MRYIRSLYFAGLAGLALFAIMVISGSPRAYSVEMSVQTIEAVDYLSFESSILRPAFAQAVLSEIPRADRNLQAVVYASQNQTGASWRVNVDAYRLIDPHIYFA